jgi:hypothetical protein
MTGNRIWLGGLLVAQLALAVGLYWSNERAGEVAPEAPLLAADTASVDRLRIGDGSQQVELVRAGEGWALADSGLPADGAKVDGALERLSSTATGWPVTTTEAAHQRFEVDRDDYQRHLRAFAGDDEVADFFLGTSPGFRTAHLRRDGEDAVYVVGLNTFDLPADADGWLDRDLLAVPGADSIEGPDYALAKVDEQWRLETSPGDGKALDADRAGSLASALEGLRVQGIADSDIALPEDAALAISVGSGDARRRLEFFQQDQNYYVRRDDRGQLFRISQYDYDRIAGVDGDSLVLAESSETPGETDAPGSEAAQDS